MQNIVHTETLTFAWQRHESPFPLKGAYHTDEAEQERRPLD